MLARDRYPFLSWRGRAALLVLDALGTTGAALHELLDLGPPRLPLLAQLDAARSILLFGCLAVGDALTTTPALRALRRRWPAARLVLVTSPASASVLAGSPHVDRIVPLDLPWLVRWGEPGALGRFARTVRMLASPRALGREIGGRPDVAVIFAPDVRTFLLAARLGARWRVGHTFSGGAWLLTHPVRTNLWDGRPMVEHRLDLARAVGARPLARRTEMVVPADERRAAARWLAEQGVDARALVVALAPGAGGSRHKRWPPLHFARVGEALARDFGAAVLVVGLPSERPVVREVVAGSRAALLDATGIAPAAAIAHSRLVVCNDTGTMHVARALGAATVAIRGAYRPGDAALWGYDEPDYARLSIRMEDERCVGGRCDGCADAACMAGIPPAAVVDACRQLLAGPARPAGGQAGRRAGMLHMVLPATPRPATETEGAR